MNLQDLIIEKATRAYDLTPRLLYEKRKQRYRYLADCRHTIYYLLRKYTQMPLMEIGKLFDQNHATVLHGIRNIDTFCKNDKYFKQKVDAIQAEIESEISNEYLRIAQL